MCILFHTAICGLGLEHFGLGLGLATDGLGLGLGTAGLDYKSAYSSSCRHHPHHRCSNKIQNGRILVPASPGCPDKWTLNVSLLSLQQRCSNELTIRRCCEFCRANVAASDVVSAHDLSPPATSVPVTICTHKHTRSYTDSVQHVSRPTYIFI